MSAPLPPLPCCRLCGELIEYAHEPGDEWAFHPKREECPLAMCLLRTEAWRRLAAPSLAPSAAEVDLHTFLVAALDVIEMQDARLVNLGDARVLVYSPEHVRWMREARTMSKPGLPRAGAGEEEAK
jgi:hypothetical protein